MNKLRICLLGVLVALCLTVLVGGCVVSQPFSGSNRRSSAVVDPERLREHVTRLSTDFAPRSHAHTNNLARLTTYLREQLANSGAIITNQPYSIDTWNYENIIAVFPSSNRATLVVGAHYDACGDTPGADDNASGVAGLLELANLLGKTSLTHTVELVFYCTEEPPYFASDHMGSAYHAAALRAEERPVTAMIVLEMIGYFSQEPNSQMFPLPIMRLFYPSEGNFIAVVGDRKQRSLIRTVKAGMKGTTSLPIESLCAPSSIPGVDFSDHRCYWKEGYPAVMITDTAFYRNEAYHQHGDTADRLDYTSMANVVVAVYEALRILDGQQD